MWAKSCSRSAKAPTALIPCGFARPAAAENFRPRGESLLGVTGQTVYMRPRNNAFPENSGG